MKKIFTFGYCISRDIFNHTEEKDFEVVLNIQRMSFVLLPTKGYPVKYEDLDMDYLDDFPWEVKMMIMEVSKTGLSKIKDANADYVVMDLIEERFDFVEFKVDGNVYRCIKSEHFYNFYQKYLKDKATDYKVVSIEQYTDDEVKEYFKKSMDVLMETFSIDKLILIETYFAQKMVDDQGNITKYKDQKEIHKMNKRLVRVYKLMKEVLDTYNTEDLHYSLLKADEDTMGYANHKWGPFPVHYTDEFYVKMGNRIKEITE